MSAQHTLSGSIITLPSFKERSGRTFGTAIVVALILHAGFALWMSKPHKVGGSAGGATVDMENVNFSDATAAPEAPTDMSYRPEVANLPEANPAPADAPAGAANTEANAKMDASGLVMDDQGGNVLKIGGKGTGLEDLLALPKAGGGTGKPGVGYRIKTYPPTVPFYKVEVKPTPISVPVPTYPEAVRTAGIEGSVVVEALLDLDGTVMDARILKTSGNEQLDAAAVDAAKLAKFTPAKQRDKPVRVWISIPYRFTLH